MIDTSQRRGELESTIWDVAVIGAGPGGAVAAREAARCGLRTVLIEARAFPRSKVCGGCLNRRAIQVLDDIGLAGLVEQLGGEPVRGLTLKSGAHSARISLPPGIAVTRYRFDAALLNAAEIEGVTVAHESSATVEPEIENGLRLLTLRQHDRTFAIRSRVVICADGLLRSSLRLLPAMAPSPTSNSRIGVGIVLSHDEWLTTNSQLPPSGEITMVIGTGGYCGIAWAESSQISLAAAVDPAAVKSAGSPAVVVRQILQQSGLQLPASQTGWQGTPPLTTSPQCNATERLFVIGDAAGYVEPFTGEGMAAALEQAVAVLPLVQDAVRRWRPHLSDQWQQLHRAQFQRRMRVCRFAAAVLHRPWLSVAAVRFLKVFPAAAGFFVNSINLPSALPSHPIETP